MDAIEELRVRAKILHRSLNAAGENAIKRLRGLPQFRRSSAQELIRIATETKRQDCLAILAAELGFPNWPQAKMVLAGEGEAEDFGTLLCPARCGAHLSRWYKGYEEAAEVRGALGGYLLAYRHQYLVVDRFYIESLGLDPDDPDWEALGYDWVRPGDVAARTRLYSKLVASLPRETGG